MHQILIWPLTDSEKIIWAAVDKTLDSITCCSIFQMLLYVGEQEYSVFSCSGSELIALQKQLEAMFNGQKSTGFNNQKFEIMLQGQQAQFKIYLQDATQLYSLELEQLFVFIKQLELLSIVILENENEKHERSNNRCC